MAIDPESIQYILKEIATINDEMGTLRDAVVSSQINIAQIQNDVSWLKQFFWVLVVGIGGQLIAQYFQWKSTKKSIQKNGIAH